MSWPWLDLRNLTRTSWIAWQDRFFSNEPVIAIKVDWSDRYELDVEYTAECRGRSTAPRIPELPHVSPGSLCTCGFYAWKPSMTKDLESRHAVYKVELYGHVIEHERGYRAEKMRPIELLNLPTMSAAHLHDENGVVINRLSSVEKHNDVILMPTPLSDVNRMLYNTEGGLLLSMDYERFNRQPPGRCDQPGHCFMIDKRTVKDSGWYHNRDGDDVSWPQL